MLKKSITYENFNEETVTEDLYFNISKTEIIKMKTNGVMELLAEVTSPKAKSEDIIPAFEKIIGMAYGIKSEDGRSFKKSPELTDEFLSSPAYDALFMDLMTGEPIDLLRFVQGMLPKEAATDEKLIEAATKAGIDLNIAEKPLSISSQVSIQKPVSPVSKAADAVNSDIPAPFQNNAAAAEARSKGKHGQSGDPRKRAVVVTPSPVLEEEQEPKPLNEMTEEELRAELTRLRSN
jgi:hypothetical protein